VDAAPVSEVMKATVSGAADADAAELIAPAQATGTATAAAHTMAAIRPCFMETPRSLDVPTIMADMLQKDNAIFINVSHETAGLPGWRQLPFPPVGGGFVPRAGSEKLRNAVSTIRNETSARCRSAMIRNETIRNALPSHRWR
jgi:hypothetical protein